MQLTSACAHADSNQLMAWLGSLPAAPHRVFVTHGDPEASDRLRFRIEHKPLARAGAGAWQHVEHVEHLNAPLRRCAFSPGGGSHQWPGEAGSTVFFGWVTRSRQRAETFFH